MYRAKFLCALVWTIPASSVLAVDAVQGTYVEARTCQIYTGPCFANGEVGSAGKDAIMAWRITEGTFEGADLSGQAVAVVVKASETLGFNGFADAKTTKAVLFVSESASADQAKALQSFALHQTGMSDRQLVGIERTPIDLDFDLGTLTATVKVGDFAQLATRKARPNDCICSNESAYYPPLTKLKGFVPGVTTEGEVTARKLGTRWSIPDTRTAYLGTFHVDSPSSHLAKNE